jgi:predicted PurR-regulated permease PerM
MTGAALAAAPDVPGARLHRSSDDRRRLAIEVPAATVLKLLFTAALIWIWLQIWQVVLLALVVIVLSVALDPIVGWLERRRVPRGLAAFAVTAAIFVLIVVFIYGSGASLAGESRLLGTRLRELQQELSDRIPQVLLQLLPHDAATASPLANAVLPLLNRTGRALVAGIAVLALALVLTMYMLIEGRRTYAWVLAYVPPHRRARADATACAARNAILAYVAGNVATSVFAFAFAYTVLALLHVPAALLLALLAGICDFIPVLGFPLSAAPAVLLALTRSTTTGITVGLLYAAYHVIENYAIAPKVYGDRLRLSNLAVLFAFAAGAELGGIVGALLALPAAAMYPAIEQLWLKRQLGPEVVEQHRRIERQA